MLKRYIEGQSAHENLAKTLIAGHIKSISDFTPGEIWGEQTAIEVSVLYALLAKLSVIESMLNLNMQEADREEVFRQHLQFIVLSIDHIFVADLDLKVEDLMKYSEMVGAETDEAEALEGKIIQLKSQLQELSLAISSLLNGASQITLNGHDFFADLEPSILEQLEMLVYSKLDELVAVDRKANIYINQIPSESKGEFDPNRSSVDVLNIVLESQIRNFHDDMCGVAWDSIVPLDI